MYTSVTEMLASGRSTHPAPAEIASPARSAAPTVLLVDDDRDFRVALAEALADEGYRVIEARSGEAALAVLDHVAEVGERGPDLLVLDLLMPRMSGIELLQRLRQSPRWAELPVLVVTGANDPMLPVRLDAPVAFKPDTEVVLGMIRHLAAHASASPGALPTDGA